MREGSALMDNQTIAHRLSDYATELYAAGSNLYRVRAYRKAAWTVRALERPLEEVLAEEGRAGLEVLPGVGAHLAYTIEELIRTGEFRTYQPLAASHRDALPRAATRCLP